MSLKVWLPLTGHLENQGLSDISVTNNGATVDNSGKLGKCYLTNGSNQYISGTYNGTTNISFSAWVYMVTVKSGHIFDARNSDGSGYQPIYVTANSLQIGGSGTNYATFSYTWSANTWYHICVVHNATDGKLYINGELIGTSTSAKGYNYGVKNFTLGCRCNQTSYTNVKLNDVRIYDHALSPKEVKLLSQGLVAHYTLGDRFLEGTTNLITSLTQGGQTTVSGNSVTTSGQNKDTYFTINLSESIVSGTQYTISCYAEGIPDGSTWTFPLGAQGNTNLSWVIHNGYNAYTFTANSINWGTNRLFMDDISRTFYGITKFSNFQLEKKDHATGYAGMGGTRNDTTVYDCSGYNNHLTAVNSPTIASDTARYSVSTHFNNGQYIIANENSNTGWLPTDSITVNLWTYITTWGNPISCTEGGGWNFEDAGGSSGIRFPIYVKGVGYVYKNSGVTTTSLLNGWHMLTGTFDKTTSKIYVDGELKGETTASTSNIIQYSSARLCISAEAQGTTPASSTMVGNISDVRIYATALSAEDIQQLYNAPVNVSNTGAMFTQGEFIES